MSTSLETFLNGFINYPRDKKLHGLRARRIGTIATGNRNAPAGCVRVRLLEGRGGYKAGREITLLPGVFVREMPKAPELTGAEIVGLMKEAKVTIKEVAAAMQVTQARVKAVRADGVKSEGFVRDWREGIQRAHYLKAAPGEVPEFYACGICSTYHRATWDGDCREDAARLDPNQLDKVFGIGGWREVDMPGTTEEAAAE